MEELDVTGSTTPQPTLHDLAKLGLVSVVAILATVTLAHAVPVTVPGTAHSYELIEEEKTWLEAESAARSMSTKDRSCHLATITSEAENDFVVGVLGTAEAWIGGQRKAECWGSDDASNWGTWVTGEPWFYTNWSDDEPDECEESCLQYDEADPPGNPPKWGNGFCDGGPSGEEDKLWYLVECQRAAVAPALSGPAAIIVSLLLAVGGWWALTRRSRRAS